MEALRKQATSGNADINAFWKQVTAEGTPLVESIEKDPQHQLVTFLWRGTSETRNVFPIGSFKIGGRYPLDYVFHQIPLTDVWYLTVRLPTGARFTYALSENDPLVFSGFQPERFATTQVDPLNSRRWGCAPDATRYDCQSMAEIKGAVPQPWTVKNSNVAAGTIEKQKIHSAFLKNDQSLRRPASGESMLTRQHLKAMFFHETYQLLRMKSLSRFIGRTGTAALSAPIGIQTCVDEDLFAGMLFTVE